MTTTYQEKFDYHRPLEANEVQVTLAARVRTPKIDELAFAVAEAGSKYGYRFQVILGELNESANAEAFMIKHLILLDSAQEIFSHKRLFTYIDSLLMAFTSISFAIDYVDSWLVQDGTRTVAAARERYGDRVNFIWPDVFTSGSAAVSVEKIVENAICDTVRIKYKPVLLEHKIVPLPKEVRSYFLSVSEAIGTFKMYHRWPTDGYIACRISPDSQSFFVTATKSNKVSLDFQRIVLVEAYDEASNRLSYKGLYLPSSDAVEAAMVFRDCPDVQALVHTHASEMFTRNPTFLDRVSKMDGSYGEARVGRTLVAAVARSHDGFVIMEDHGEVFAVNEITPNFNFSKVVEKIERSGNT